MVSILSLPQCVNVWNHFYHKKHRLYFHFHQSFRLATLQWRHNGRGSVSNHQPHDCLLNRLFRRRSKKTSKLRVTGLCAGNSPGTGEFPAQMASNAENVSIWWRHYRSASIWSIDCLYNPISVVIYITCRLPFFQLLTWITTIQLLNKKAVME